MNELDPLVAVPAEQAVQSGAPGAEQPPATAEQEQVADGVFSKGPAQLAHAALGLNMGLGLLHHLAVETFGGKAKEEEEDEKEAAPPGRPEDEPTR